MGDLLTVDELASWLKISSRSVRELCRERTRTNQKLPIPVVRIGRQVRFAREAVAEWLKQLQEAAA